jgi:hypothetical protein
VLHLSLPKQILKTCKDQQHLMDEVQKYFTSKSLNPEDSDQPIDAIVENLIKDLYTKHQRKKVWLLLDNYDIPMIRAIKHGFIDAPEIKELYA